MKRSLNILKILKFGTQNFARNFWLGVLTISILVFLLISINGLTIINFITNEANSAVTSKVDISIYLKSEASAESAQSLRSYILGLPKVTNVDSVSADEALKKFKDEHKNDEAVISSLSLLDKNPFGGYLVVRTTDVDDYKSVLKQLDTPVYKNIIDNKDFSDHEALVGIVSQLTSRVKQFVLVISLFFAFISAIIIFNTIKISIYTHKEEIAIMNLVGASDWFVGSQFLFLVLLYSAIATVISMALIFPLIYFIQPKVVLFLNGSGGDIFGYYRGHIFSLMAQQFLLLAILSSLSAYIAISRYLRK